MKLNILDEKESNLQLRRPKGSAAVLPVPLLRAFHPLPLRSSAQSGDARNHGHPIPCSRKLGRHQHLDSRRAERQESHRICRTQSPFRRREQPRHRRDDETAGNQNHYSIPGLKVHAKVALVRRRGPNGEKIPSYAYISTATSTRRPPPCTPTADFSPAARR